MMTCCATQNYKPREAHEETALLSGAVGAKPIFILEMMCKSVSRACLRLRKQASAQQEILCVIFRPEVSIGCMKHTVPKSSCCRAGGNATAICSSSTDAALHEFPSSQKTIASAIS